LKTINSKTSRAKSHTKFVKMAMLAKANSNDKYKGFRVKRNGPLIIIFVVGLLQFMAVSFFL
jgi:hypothetical protein